MAKIIATCKCGATFSTTETRIADGRGKYCSRECKYQFMIRPIGLTYNITRPNAGWFKEGNRPVNPFGSLGHRGFVPPKGAHMSPSTEFVSGGQLGDKNTNYKGDAVGYAALHGWVRRHKTKPPQCAHCGKATKLVWANKSWEYRRDLDDWLALCAKCHQQYDRSGPWGIATRTFPELAR